MANFALERSQSECRMVRSDSTRRPAVFSIAVSESGVKCDK